MSAIQIGILFAAVMIAIITVVVAVIEYRTKKGNVGRSFYLKLLIPFIGIIIGSLVAYLMY